MKVSGADWKTVQRGVKELKGALYLYFPSKEALYLAISEHWNCSLEAAIRARLTPDLTPAEILCVLVEVNGEHVQAESDACRVLMEGWNLGSHIPVLAERARQREVRSLSAICQLLQAGINAGELRADMVVEAQARMLMATLHGLIVQWHRLPGSVDWRAIAVEIIRGLRTSS